jgi:hypothetical protein
MVRRAFSFSDTISASQIPTQPRRWSETSMYRRRRARRLLASALLATLATLTPFGMPGPVVRAAESCTLDGALHGTTCRLIDGQPVAGTLRPGEPGATYRVDAYAADASLDVTLAASNGNVTLDVLDWRGASIGSASAGDGGAEARFSVVLPLPGAYRVQVGGEIPPEGQRYRLTTRLVYPGAAARPVWPAALQSPDLSLAEEHHLVRVPRGGTPNGGVAAGRILAAPPAGIFSDFTMVADVQFEQVVGPSALTVRFRYEPEAGGGTGYVLSIDPFANTATLDEFDEGQRRSIVGGVPLPVVPTPDSPNRLVLTAAGPVIRATIDGQPLLEVGEARFTRGLIAVGAVTWSDPMAVIFDHIQVTSPAS